MGSFFWQKISLIHYLWAKIDKELFGYGVIFESE